MRYVGKIYVLDVLDQIVLSGYVRDSETLDLPAADPLEFTHQIRGRGESDPALWLCDGLFALARDLQTGRLTGRPRAGTRGGPHTISGSGDSAESLMGLTAVGGVARTRGQRPARGSGGIRG